MSKVTVLESQTEIRIKIFFFVDQCFPTTNFEIPWTMSGIFRSITKYKKNGDIFSFSLEYTLIYAYV